VSKSGHTKILVLNPYNIANVAKELRLLAQQAISSAKIPEDISEEDINKLYLATIYLELHLLERFLILELPEGEAQRQCFEITQFLLNSVYKDIFKVDIVPPNVVEYFATYFSSNYKFIHEDLILAPMPYKKDDNQQLPQLFDNFCKCIEEAGVVPFNVAKAIAQSIWDNWPQITSKEK